MEAFGLLFPHVDFRFKDNLCQIKPRQDSMQECLAFGINFMRNVKLCSTKKQLARRCGNFSKGL